LFCSRDLGWLTTGNSDIYVTVAADHVEFYQNQQVFMGWIKHLAGQIVAHGPYVGHPRLSCVKYFRNRTKALRLTDIACQKYSTVIHIVVLNIHGAPITNNPLEKTFISAMVLRI